jgi:hypothetical protein
MDDPRQVVAGRPIDGRILHVRNQRVMLDADLADLYGVTTRRLAEQVRRNLDRFPRDFLFRLTARERDDVLALRPDLERLKRSRELPRAFTEHGVLMVANVLDSGVALQVSIEIVRAFVRMREVIAEHRDLTRRIDALEARYEGQFKEVFDAIKEMMALEDASGRPIGFRAGEGP